LKQQGFKTRQINPNLLGLDPNPLLHLTICRATSIATRPKYMASNSTVVGKINQRSILITNLAKNRTELGEKFIIMIHAKEVPVLRRKDGVTCC
jgi:hypothetical protein